MILLAGLSAVAAVVFAVVRSESSPTYAVDEVAAAFNNQGLTVREVSPPPGVNTHGSSYLNPEDRAFTVTTSAAQARPRNRVGRPLTCP